VECETPKTPSPYTVHLADSTHRENTPPREKKNA
jgi:hypothetical protein